MSQLGFFDRVPDEEYVRRAFQSAMGRPLDLEHTVTYTEKLQWLKINDHNPVYTQMADKVGAKDFAARRIGSEYIIPTLGVWERAEDVDFWSLPEQFVLKCSHNSGLGMVICEDRSKLDENRARRLLAKGLRQNYYLTNREWPYRDVKPRILAEPFLRDEQDGELRDYKFFTFGGEPKVVYITQGRAGGETTADFYDMEFRHLDLKIDHEMAPVPPHRPEHFETMQKLAALLAEGTPQLRVDFYEVNGQVYFGEMTFFHCAGLAPFYPASWDRVFGDWVQLPE